MRNTDYRGHSIVITTVDRTSESAGTWVVGIYKHGKTIHRDERRFSSEDTALAAARAWLDDSTLSASP
jgi:hypothetical protein